MDSHKITLATFLNEPSEVHAFVIGLCHTIQRKAPYRFDELVDVSEFSPEVVSDLRSEYHYYYAGFWIPRVILVVIVLAFTPIDRLWQIMASL